MKQRHILFAVEFFESQDPKRVEEIVRKHLPSMRKLVVAVDHKNFMYEKKSRVNQNLIGRDIELTYLCPKDGTTWKRNGIVVQDGYYIWANSDICPNCGTRGELTNSPFQVNKSP